MLRGKKQKIQVTPGPAQVTFLSYSIHLWLTGAVTIQLFILARENVMVTGKEIGNY
jgi:hypothetical protein